MTSIFVAIASYRDPECQWTIRHLFEHAAHPERVFVGVCWQYILPQDKPCFQVPPPRPGQVRRRAFDAHSSRGCCWARRIAHDLRQGEDYVLQVDSHMRFAPGWDDRLIAMLAACPSDKPVLTTYPAPYTLPDSLQVQTPRVAAKVFDADGILRLRSVSSRLKEPRRAAFFVGGFLFAEARLFDEVPYDPSIYFTGEEISFSARAWTRGWDAFTPHECLLHHLYLRKDMPKHWKDNPRWGKRHRKSVQRIRQLLGVEAASDREARAGLDGPLGLGETRTLEAYQSFAGVDFKARTISEKARLGRFD